MPAPICRFCRHPLTKLFVDLGMSPLCQTHITAEQLNSMEPLSRPELLIFHYP
jgi:hypothetical protein